jgi:Rod binding domain-containing protein
MSVDTGSKIGPPVDLPQTARAGLSAGKQAKKVAEQFESFLMFSVLKECEKSINTKKKSYAEETQMSLFYERVADALAKKGVGIRETLTKSLEKGASKSSAETIKVFDGTTETR